MKIGFIGLGRMGGAMARNVRAAGHELLVNDIRREACAGIVGAGAEFAATPAEIARLSEIVMISVPGPDEVEAVLSGPGGLVAGLSPDMMVLDLTTITPRQSRENAERCRERGAVYLDAPVSGGAHGAASKDLTAMVGGEAAAFTRAKPILECVAKTVIHVGPLGTGSAIKLLNQAIYISYQMVFAEGLALGEDVGLDVDTMLDVLGMSAAGHPMISAKYDEIRGKSDSPGFAVDNGLLFMDLVREACADVGYATPIFETVAASLRKAEAEGLGSKDMIRARGRYRRVRN